MSAAEDRRCGTCGRSWADTAGRLAADGQWYCESHAPNDRWRCATCGASDATDLYPAADGGWYCGEHLTDELRLPAGLRIVEPPGDPLPSASNGSVPLSQTPRDGGTVGHPAIVPKLRVLDVEHMLTTEPPPVPWIVEPLLVAGCVSMCAGREGTGKSMLALALASAIGHGATIAGMDCQQGPTLFVDAENGSREVHRRVRGIGVKAGTLTYVEAQGFNLATDITLLEDLVTEHKPSVLILDSLRSLAPGLDENDSKQAEAAVRPVSRLAQRFGIPVLLLHHAGKNGSEYRGSTAIGAAVELGFTLSRHDEDPDVRTRRKLACWKSRPAPEPDVRWLSLDAAGGRILIGEAEPFKPAQVRERDKHRDAVLAFREQGLSVREIAQRVELSKSSVQRILEDCPSVPDPLGGWDAGTPPESGSATGDALSQQVGTPGTAAGVATLPPPTEMATGNPHNGHNPDAELERLREKYPDLEATEVAARCRCEKPDPDPDEDGDPQCGKCGRAA